jgi:hypothetical protein
MIQARDTSSDTEKTSQSTSVTPGHIDATRVKAQMRRWQDRVLDLTKSNPLIGLNRSRVAKFSVIKPDANAIFSMFVIEEKQLRMPLVRKHMNHPEQPYSSHLMKRLSLSSSPEILPSTRNQSTSCADSVASTTMRAPH